LFVQEKLADDAKSEDMVLAHCGHVRDEIKAFVQAMPSGLERVDETFERRTN
jgi:hypothetical protein